MPRIQGILKLSEVLPIIPSADESLSSIFSNHLKLESGAHFQTLNDEYIFFITEYLQ